MKKLSSNNFIGFLHPNFKYVALFMLGVFLIFIRNMNPITQPAMYTEDGLWLGMAFSNGWPDALLNAKDGYFVWGNLLLLWLSSQSSFFFCGDKLACLPQSIAIWSYTFFATTAVLTFWATKAALPIQTRWLLFFLMIAIPLGDSSNEIIGRISNIGYLMVFWCVLLVYHKVSTQNAGQGRLLIDFILLLSAATNPLCYVLIPMLTAYSVVFNGFYRPFDFIREFFRENKILMIGLVAIFLFQSIIFFERAGPSTTGSLNLNNLVEVGVARSLLYPIVFPIYKYLNDTTTLVIFFCFLLLLAFLAWGARKDRNVILLVSMASIGLFLFWFATLWMRQSLTEQLGGYQTTFPDRYFMGLNILIIFIFVSLAGSRTVGSRKYSLLKQLVLFSVGGLYALHANTIFELNNPRMRIVTGPSFQEEICFITPNINSSDAKIFMPIYFDGWAMEIPFEMILRARNNIDCSKRRTSFYLTDDNWNRGLSKHWAGFYVPNQKPYSDQYKPRKFVLFGNGESREILAITISGRYLHVKIDGSVLNPDIVGPPNDFKVVDDEELKK